MQQSLCTAVCCVTIHCCTAQHVLVPHCHWGFAAMFTLEISALYGIIIYTLRVMLKQMVLKRFCHQDAPKLGSENVRARTIQTGTMMNIL